MLLVVYFFYSVGYPKNGTRLAEYMLATHQSSTMSVRTVVGFYRTYWLSLTLCLGIMALYFASAIAYGDHWHALAGMFVLGLGVGLLWRRYDP